MKLPKQVSDFIKTQNPKYKKAEFSYNEDSGHIMRLTVDLIENIINPYYSKSVEDVGTGLYNF